MLRTKRRTAVAGREAAPRLMLDLDTFRVAGVGCGDPASRFRFLGTGCAVGGEWEYPAHGLTIAVGGGRVLGFRVHVRPTAADVAAGMRPFAGALCYRGRSFDPRTITCEADVAAWFGVPADVRQLPEGWALAYRTDRVAWEVVLSADGRLAQVAVSLST